jgi:hypothetical protein
MQGTGIGTLMQQGVNGEQLTPVAAEEEYSNALSRLMGEQYELLPPSDPGEYMMPSPLYTIRHVLRTTTSSIKVLGIYYVVEGVIYKSPAVLSLMKANVTRTLDGLSEACQALSVCARYQPSLGYAWVFEDDNKDNIDPISLIQLAKRRKRRKILDNRRPGERTAAEEEGIRASEAMNQILVRISKSPALTGKPKSAASTTTKGPLPLTKEVTRASK